MTGVDFIARMERGDKYQLSGGVLIFAPRYPQWLERPGWWDGITWHDEIVGPLFSWTLLEEGKEIALRFAGRRWSPGSSVSTYECTGDLKVNETRFITPDNRAVSMVGIADTSGRQRNIDLVFWSRRLYRPDLSRPADIKADEEGAEFLIDRHGRRSHCVTRWRLASDRSAYSFAVADAECLGPGPEWRQTPFATAWRGALSGEVRINDPSRRGAVWFAHHYKIVLDAESPNASVSFWTAVDHTESPKSEPLPGKKLLADTLKTWSGFFAGVPEFACDDERWEHLYRYRWYLIRQCLKAGGRFRQPFDGVCEGPDFFHQPISYSTPPIIFDLRWHRDPNHAREQMLNFCECRERDGRLPGALFHDCSREEFFYHSDWGRALERLHLLHPSEEFLAQTYPALKNYARWLAKSRDRKGSGMIDVINMMETGQEFSSRYIPLKKDFEDDDWIETAPMKGVDATVYYYFLLRALALAAEEIGKHRDERRWRSAMERTAAAITSRMWLPGELIFSDLLSTRGKLQPTRVRALTGFYPFLTGLTGREHLDSIERVLLDPREFWAPHPVATLSRTDANFSCDGVWRGKVRNCPWNGRVWPMTNSHVVEILAEMSGQAPALREKCAELLHSFARLFAPGDPKLVSSYEHYSPRDGSACAYRGIDDYLHCWVIDLIIRYVAGFRPGEEGILVDPMPLGLGRIELRGVPFRGGLYNVSIADSAARIELNGQVIAEGPTPLQVELKR